MSRYRTEAEVERDDRNALGAGIAIVVLLLGVFFVAPGMMLVTFAVRPFAMAMDRGQLWTFSVVACFATFGGIRLASGSSRLAVRWYAVLCALSLFSFAAAKFGMHAEWPDLMFDAFTRGPR